MSRGNFDEKTPLLTSSHHMQGSNAGLDEHGNEERADTNIAHEQIMDPEVNGAEDMYTHDGPIVGCRVCEAEISIDGKTNQHVVRCQSCNEVTPIKPAPPGKKYVRCPCNCLLVCKASSNRIACPRPNCRRVITLAPSAPVGTAVRAPAGTCRVQCVHCLEIFMFNALANQVANCPHCKRSSSVGNRYARSRTVIFGLCTVIASFVLLGLTIGVFTGAHSVLYFLIWIALIMFTGAFAYKLVYYARLKVSQVLGPI